MCGRYTANTEDEVIEIRNILAGLTMRLAGDMLDDDVYNHSDTPYYGKLILPSDNAPVITNDNKLILSHFGFNKWDDSGLIINARSETAGTSRFFAPYIKKSRCIVPASHYFEWKKAPGTATVKYRLGAGNKHGIFMAGFLNQTPGKESFVILTKPAGDNIRFIHDRMPVLLSAEQIKSWLDCSLDIDDLSSVSFSDISYEKAV